MKVQYNDVEVQKLLDAYQQLLGIRISVLNSEFIGLYRSPRRITSFCQKIRLDSNVNDACIQCDHIAYNKSRLMMDTYIYKCHLGLYEAITPIIDQERIIGYLMIGQILDTTNRLKQWELMLKAHLPTYDHLINCEEDFYALKQVSLDDFKAMSHIMKALAHSILLNHIIHIENSPITDLIHQYIESYYDETLSVERISKALNISRTTIYNYMKKEYNMSLTEYINAFRLEKSIHLLKTTNHKISLVAQKVGYDNYNYYSRIFKSTYGCTPSQYRLR